MLIMIIEANVIVMSKGIESQTGYLIKKSILPSSNSQADNPNADWFHSTVTASYKIRMRYCL